MMSSRTLGTSAKKKRAKKPATPPNPAARAPLGYVRICVWHVRWEEAPWNGDVLLCGCADGEAVIVLRNGVSVVVVSSAELPDI
jgi:hypothetical protein